MVRLSTQYDATVVDNKKVGKVFMVRGDEAYARTTNTKLEIIDDATNSRDAVEGYRCGFKYDVLRDLGSSSVVLCNGEDELAQYDWSSNDGERYVGVLSNHTTIDPNTCLTLAYGVEHQLYMKYKGNKQCLRSKSRITTIHEPLPDKFKTELDLTYNVTGQGVVLTITVTVNGQHIPATHNKTIEIYVDDELVDTTTTGANTNVATKTLQLEGGKSYSITAVLQGDETIHMGSATIDIPLGFNVVFVEKPSYIVRNLNNVFRVRVTDTQDTPVENATVTLGELSSTTDSLGVATFNVTSPFIENKYQAVFNNVLSEEIIVPIYDGMLLMSTSLGVNMYSDKVSAIGYTNLLTISFDKSVEDISNIPITLIARNYDWDNNIKGNDIIFHKTYITDSSGNVTIDLLEEDPNGEYTRRVLSAYVGEYPNYDTSTEVSMIMDKVFAGRWGNNDRNRMIKPDIRNVEIRNGFHEHFIAYEVIEWGYSRNMSDPSQVITPNPTIDYFYIGDWALEFENSVLLNSSSMKIYISNSNSVTIPKQASRSSLKIYKKGSTLKIYRNGVLIGSHQYTRATEPRLEFTNCTGVTYGTRMMAIAFYSIRYMKLV